MARPPLFAWLLAALCAWGLGPRPALAEDTDLFVNNPSITGQLSNVLFIVDNSANWSSTMTGGTKFSVEQSALSQVFSELTANQVRLGLMMFTETGKGNSGPDGGYVRYAVQTMSTTNISALRTLISGLDIGNDKGNGSNNALAMHEAYLYFNGSAAYAGVKAKTDSANAFTTSPTYKSPKATGTTCAKNVVIFISNGSPSNGENTTAGNLLNGLGGRFAGDPIALSPSGSQASWADEYARFMNSKGISTYTLDINPLSTTAGLGNTALLKSMARQGNGGYFRITNGTELQAALRSIINSVVALNSVFAATTLPVSVNVRGTYLNEVYMAVFRPDALSNPRWFGNLKLYQLGLDSATNSLYLADASGAPALESTTGFIKADKSSFWTSASTYWSFDPRGTPTPTSSDSPDGEVVEKGAAAQIQRTNWTNASRKLYTCTGACTNNSLLSATPFATSNTAITATALSNTSASLARTVLASEVADIVNWVRGQDVLQERDPAALQVRPSIHGDVLHSRPAVINYARDGSENDIVVFYGANDGVFRAITGGKGNVNGGKEVWGFVPSEMFNKLVRLYDNAPEIVTGNSPKNKTYFLDGNVTFYANDVNKDGRLRSADGDKVYIYAMARRGGRLMYAFDVSDPDNPRLLWKVTNSSSGMAELGQTWSEAKVATVMLGTTATPVLIFGAGYDPAADDDTAGATARTMGRGIYVLNAITGAVIWSAGPSGMTKTVAGMTNSIPAEVAVLDRDGDGYADRVYAADTAGNVWRLDIGATSTANWYVNKLASLASTGVDARKFLAGVDVVYANDANGAYDAVLVGSGDREKPFDLTITNRFYMLKDRATASVSSDSAITAITETDLYDTTANLIQTGTTTQIATAKATLLAAKGWYVTLGVGEKTSGGSSTIAGTTFFGTTQPKVGGSADCSANIGTARTYAMNFKDASATFNFDATNPAYTAADRVKVMENGGYLPTPTPIVVQVGDKRRLAVCFGPTCINYEQNYGRRGRAFYYKTID